MEEHRLVYQVDHDSWTEVVLNHPKTRNALTGPLGEELLQAIDSFQQSETSRVMLIRGAEGAFCSGLNLKEFNREPRPEWMKNWPSIYRQIHTKFFECTKPTVAAVERFAINAGSALALAADLMLVGGDSYIQVGEVKQGMAAPYNLAWLHLRHSEAQIAQLTLTGDQMSGEDLYRLGIAYAAPPTNQVLEMATQLCEKLSSYPPGALQGIKGISRGYRGVTAEGWFDIASKNAPSRSGTIPRVS